MSHVNMSDTVSNNQSIHKHIELSYWQKIAQYITKYPELPDLMFYVVQNQPVKVKTLVDQLKQRNHLPQTTAYRRIQWLLSNDIFYNPQNEKNRQSIRIRPGMLSPLKQLQKLTISQQWIFKQKKKF